MSRIPIILIVFFSVCLLFSCSENSSNTDPLHSDEATDGFQLMNDSITQILSNLDLSASTYENDARIKKLEKQLIVSKDMSIHFNYARELLNNGDTKQAISYIENIIQQTPQIQPIDPQSKIFHEFLAICYLRDGEQENCLKNHNDQSCIVPIEKNGIHTNVSGSERAIAKYTELLKIFPDDYQSMWLLNIAYMTLDQYPAGVPKSYLIDISKNGGHRYYENIATQSGIDWFGLSGGSIAEDFNNDGLTDIITSTWGTEGQLKYFLNDGEKGFRDVTKESKLDQAKGGLNLVQTDFNNDGFKDIYIIRGAWMPNLNWGVLPNSLLRNNGDGTFSDVTIEVGLYHRAPGQSAVWADFNNDGNLDLFTAYESVGSSTEKFPCQLFFNVNGQFTDVSEKYGLNLVGYFKGTVAGDINNDGWQDLYITDLDGPNQLFVALHSDGKFTGFSNVTSSSGTTLPNSAFGCWFFDFDNDGWEDIYVASYDRTAFLDQSGQFARDILGKDITSEENCLYHNNQNGTFTNVTNKYFTAKALSTMGCNVGDVNNDGYPDFYLGTGAPDYRAVVPNRLFVNRNGKSFEDETFVQGLGHIQKGHGISFADFDNDGDQDIHAVMGGAFKGDKFPNAFFENKGSENRWIKLQLNGKTANQPAIGARVNVVGKSKSGKSESYFKSLNSGGSFGANPLIIEMGLGDMIQIDEIRICWPKGSKDYETYSGFETNSKYVIYEDGTKEKVTLNSFPFKKDGAAKQGHQHH